MLDQEDIDYQLKLLEAHRRTLAHSLEQYNALGVLTPSALVHSIREAWAAIAQIKTPLRASGVLVADEPNDEPYELHITVPTLTPQERRNRQRMLQKVRDFWIKGVLENSLHNAALIKLGMEYTPDAVQHPWDMVIQSPAQPTRTIQPDSSITDVFDQSGGELVILGAPGSGKTTMILELARDLIGRAEQDERHPLPVVFNLSSWAAKRLVLSEWLIDELNTKYDVPQKIGKAWIEDDQVLLLLDGLDEVKEEFREACVAAINIFRHTHGLVSIVVCSRLADYDVLAERLKLQGAIRIHPLTSAQLDAYLMQAGDQFTVLRATLSTDATLRELAQAPLTLSIMLLAYHGVTTDMLRSGDMLEDAKKRLFDVYVERMFSRRGEDNAYSRHQVMRRLSWLSRVMIRQAESLFFIERLQPTMFATRAQLWWYTIADRLGGAMILGIFVSIIINVRLLSSLNVVTLYNWLQNGINFGLAVGLVVGLFSTENELNVQATQATRTVRNAVLGSLICGLVNGFVIGGATGLVVGLSADRAILARVGLTWFTLGLLNAEQGFVVGVLAGLLAGALNGKLSIRPRRIVVVETLRWSKSKALRSALNAGFSIIGGFFIVVIVLNIFNSLLNGDWPLSLALESGANFVIALVIALLFGLTGGMSFAVIGGITSGEVETKIRANQGIWRSARNAIVIAFSVGVTVGAIIIIASILFNLSIENTFSNGLAYGLSSGIIIGIAFGGRACLSHIALRLVFWRSGMMPLNYVRFLDYCAERIFLRKVGGGYIFVHRMLMEYFAELDTSQLPTHPSAHAEQ